jgi:uncharacterized protein YjcR
VGGLDAKDLAYKDYLSGMKYKDIAEKYNVSLNTVKSWKTRNGWNRKEGAYSKKVCTQKQKGAPRKRGGQPGNRNAVGHGGKPENKNAEKHGFFSKWLPAETLEIMQEIEEKSPADILWEQIIIQYTAIIRAQKLMFVKDQKDKTVEMVKTGDSGIEYDIQQAWDKHEKFLSAQSRAMTTLNGLIKQYEDMLRNDSEAKEIAEERRARIAKIKAETTRINADKGAGIGDVIFSGEGDLDD